MTEAGFVLRAGSGDFGGLAGVFGVLADFGRLWGICIFPPEKLAGPLGGHGPAELGSRLGRHSRSQLGADRGSLWTPCGELGDSQRFALKVPRAQALGGGTGRTKQSLAYGIDFPCQATNHASRRGHVERPFS